MQTSAVLHRSLSALLPLALLLASAVADSAQTVINSLPYTITTKGLYVLNNDLDSTQTSGNLITVNASNVTIDLQGHYLSGPSNGSSNGAYGIHASERANLTIRNGTISHCNEGIYLEGNNNASTTNNLNHSLDNLRVSHCTNGITLAVAPGSTVTNCKLTQISNDGISVIGAGSTVQGCLLGQIGSVGIQLDDNGSFARQNTISNAVYGIYGGKYQDNLTSSCTMPFLRRHQRGRQQLGLVALALVRRAACPEPQENSKRRGRLPPIHATGEDSRRQDKKTFTAQPRQANDSAIVRICTSMIRDRGDCVQAINTTPATSSGSSISDCATFSSVRPLPRANSVFTPPGQIAPTLIPFSRSSRSSACAKATWANLVMQYTASPPKPYTPAIEESIRIVPDFCASITGTVCRVNKNVERTLVSISSSYSSAEVSTRFL